MHCVFALEGRLRYGNDGFWSWVILLGDMRALWTGEGEGHDLFSDENPYIEDQ